MRTEVDSPSEYGSGQKLIINAARFEEVEPEYRVKADLKKFKPDTSGIEELATRLAAKAKPYAEVAGSALSEAYGGLKEAAGHAASEIRGKLASRKPENEDLSMLGELASVVGRRTYKGASAGLKSLGAKISAGAKTLAAKVNEEVLPKAADVLNKEVIPYAHVLSQDALEAAGHFLQQNKDSLPDPVKRMGIVKEVLAGLDGSVRLVLELGPESGTRQVYRVPGPDYRAFFSDMKIKDLEELTGLPVRGYMKKSSLNAISAYQE